mgnify:FL=1
MIQQEELIRYRTMADQNSRLRRMVEDLQAENTVLRSILAQQSNLFDQDNADMFAIIHSNHAAHGPAKIEIFRFA